MYHNFFIHSSVNGHLGCVHVLAIVNDAAVNIGVHVSFSIMFSSGYMPRSGIAGSYGSFIPSFLGISIPSSAAAAYHLPQWLYQFTFPPIGQECFHFSTPFPAFIVCRRFDEGRSDWYEVISHCHFDLHFSNNEQCSVLPHKFVSHLYVLLREMSV